MNEPVHDGQPVVHHVSGARLVILSVHEEGEAAGLGLGAAVIRDPVLVKAGFEFPAFHH